jgi:hypothetical protein
MSCVLDKDLLLFRDVISDPDAIRRGLPPAPGVYWLLALDEAALADDVFLPLPIGRGNRKVDSYGILYIGTTKSDKGGLRQRAGCDLIKALLDLDKEIKKGSKITWDDLFVGKRALFFDYFHPPGMPEIYSPRTLALAWEETYDGPAAARLEQDLIYNYRQQFAELPPFNRGFPTDLIEDEQATPINGGIPPRDRDHCIEIMNQHVGPLTVIKHNRWAPDFLTLGGKLPRRVPPPPCFKPAFQW